MSMKIKITDIKPNPSNPRVIKDDKFKKLVESIKSLPEMAEVRPIVVNKDMIVLGGNMRLKAMKEAGWKEVPVQIVDWPEDKQREFIIKDNVGFGEWEWEMLSKEWDVEQLGEWGLDVPAFNKKNDEDGEIKFSEEIDQESNYVVLKFTTDIDFLHISSLLGLESTYSKRQNGKPWSKGIGRVVDGVDAIIKIKES